MLSFAFFALQSEIKKISRRARKMLCRCFCLSSLEEEESREVFPPVLVSCGQAEPGIQSAQAPTRQDKTRYICMGRGDKKIKKYGTITVRVRYV